MITTVYLYIIFAFPGHSDYRITSKFSNMQECQVALESARVHTATGAAENEWIWTAVCLPIGDN